MHRNWFKALTAWLDPQQHDLAWAHSMASGGAPLRWHKTFAWEEADDDELLFYIALITAAHY
jgi:hypothetical protein